MDGSQRTGRLSLCIFVGLLAFSVYQSWVPFDFESSGQDGDFKAIVSRILSGSQVFSRTDICINFSYFAVVGSVGFRTFSRGLRTIRQTIAAVVITEFCVLLVSCLNEVGQVWLPTRIPSFVDVLSQVMGGTAGIVFWIAVGQRCERLIAPKLSDTAPVSKLDLCLYAYLLVYYGLSLFPFDFVVSLDELAEKWRTGRIDLRPFGDFNGTPGQIFDSMLHGFLCVPMGVFGSRYRMRQERVRPPAEGVLLGGLCVTLTEVSQVLVASRYCMVWHVIVGCLGAAIGVALTQPLVRSIQTPSSAGPRVSLIWVLCVCVSFFVPVSYVLYPFDFTRDLSIIQSQLKQVELIPFLSMHLDAPQKASDPIEKALMMLPFGVCAGRLVASWNCKMCWILLCLAITLICVTVEAVQVALPGRYVDLTTALMMSLGGIVGAILSKWVLQKNQLVSQT